MIMTRQTIDTREMMWKKKQFALLLFDIKDITPRIAVLRKKEKPLLSKKQLKSWATTWKTQHC